MLTCGTLRKANGRKWHISENATRSLSKRADKDVPHAASQTSQPRSFLSRSSFVMTKLMLGKKH